MSLRKYIKRTKLAGSSNYLKGFLNSCILWNITVNRQYRITHALNFWCLKPIEMQRIFCPKQKIITINFKNSLILMLYQVTYPCLLIYKEKLKTSHQNKNISRDCFCTQIWTIARYLLHRDGSGEQVIIRLWAYSHSYEVITITY